MNLGVVDHFAVIGSEAGLHSVIDTTLGGSSLAHASGYTKLLAAAPGNALAHIFTSPSSSAQAGAPPEEATSGLLALLAGAREANISLVPSASSLSGVVSACSSPFRLRPAELSGPPPPSVLPREVSVCSP